ncbi:MAG TPA: hypothetical protein VG798_06485 [Rhizomicrobium sp.]|nr:hypothetical protein [Rhizomicrobium sp.]
MPGFRPALAFLPWAASAFTATAGGFDNTISRVHGDLQALLHCEWQGSTPYTICPTGLVRDVVGVTADPSGDYPETIEFHPLLTVYPPDSVQNRLSRDTIMAIVGYFFPEWQDEASWVSEALKAADNEDGAEHVIKRDGATLYIRSLDVEDGEGSYALIVITKRAALDRWTIDKTSVAR